MNWRLRTGQLLRTLAGDDESVVYNDRSGETHLLGAAAVGLLEHLRKGPADFSSMCLALETTWEFESAAELQRVVLVLTDELDALGLIEPSLP
nr:HPr-rel-A system PqqD family peptide chaperone [uncultured Noviherbaspirillum sp.]